MGADVIVVGLGAMGSAAVEELSRRGVGVIGLDRWAPPHERGAHAGGSRIIRLAYAEGADYVPLLHRAYERWHDLQQRARRRLITTTGTLTIGPPGGALISGVLASVRRHGLDHVAYDPGDLPYRQFRLADDEVAVLDPAGGVLHPEAAVDACLSLAEVAGAELRVDVTVTGWRAGPSGVTVHTTAGDVTGDRLVLAAGAGAPALLPELGVPWRNERRLQHYWRPQALPEAYGGDRFPAWMWESPESAICYGLPWQDPPGGVKAAFHHGNAGPGAADPVDAETGARAATADEARPARAWLGRRLPELAEGVWLGATACVYTLTPDEHFIIGRHPEHENVAIAAGFSGHGFKFMPVVGEILADLAVAGETARPIGLFRPDRFDPATGYEPAEHARRGWAG